MRALRTLVVHALRAASPPITSIAAALGVTRSGLRRWRTGERNVPPKVAGKLAKLLRRQARDLERVAAELDRITDSGGGFNGY